MNTIAINSQSVLIKQYKGQRVLTFKDIDLVHGRHEEMEKITESQRVSIVLTPESKRFFLINTKRNSFTSVLFVFDYHFQLFQ